MQTLKRIKNLVLKYSTHEIITFAFLNLAGLNFSLVNAFPGILIAQLKKGRYSIEQPNDSQASNIASLGVLTACMATFFAGFINDQLGRKCAVTISYILSFSGWLMYYMSSSLMEIYIARIISGCTIGFSASLYQHVAEISQPSNRGMMLVGSSAVSSFGYILVFCLSNLHFRTLCLMYGFYCAVACLLHRLLVQESPTWYVQKNRLVEARRVLEKLTGNEKTAEEQLRDMLTLRKTSSRRDCTDVDGNTISEKRDFNDETKSSSCCSFLQRCWGQLKLWKERRVYKPFCILWIYMLFLPLNGVQFIICYPMSFYQLFHTPISPELAAVIFSLVTFAANLLNPFIVHKLRRRVIAVYSAVFMLLSVATLAVWQYYYLSDSNDAERHSNWQPWITVCLLCVYILTASCGNSYMPWTMASEILSQNTRAYQIGILSIWSYLLTFVTTKIYFILIKDANMPYVLLFFAAVCLVCGIYVYLFLPETYNKSLMQIEREFDADSTADNTTSSIKNTTINA